MISIRAERPVSCRRARSHSACHRASRLPRLPMTNALTRGSPAVPMGWMCFEYRRGVVCTGRLGWRTGGGIDSEDLPDELDPDPSAVLRRGALQGQGRGMQELVHQGGRHLAYRLFLGRGQVPEPGTEPR